MPRNEDDFLEDAGDLYDLLEIQNLSDVAESAEEERMLSELGELIESAITDCKLCVEVDDKVVGCMRESRRSGFMSGFQAAVALLVGKK